MAWEYKILEPLDYGHPGAEPRYGEFAEELTKLSAEGWEVVQLTPAMMRGRIVPGSQADQLNLTTTGLVALLRRKVE